MALPPSAKLLKDSLLYLRPGEALQLTHPSSNLCTASNKLAVVDTLAAHTILLMTTVSHEMGSHYGDDLRAFVSTDVLVKSFLLTQ